jgi:hypothetical protein
MRSPGKMASAKTITQRDHVPLMKAGQLTEKEILQGMRTSLGYRCMFQSQGI